MNEPELLFQSSFCGVVVMVGSAKVVFQILMSIYDHFLDFVTKAFR